MTTASTNTVLDHSSDTGYRNWAAEIIAQLLAVGLTQTADTGQINTTTVTRPAINTVNGYAMFRFNDALHATNPIFIRLDFGTGANVLTPAMRIQVGRGSNGTGTLTGLTTIVMSCIQNTIPSSTTAPYISRFCYNATQGFLGVIFKWGFNATTVGSVGGFFVFRSTDAAGDPTSDSTMVMSNQTGTTGSTSTPFTQVISHLSSTAYTTTPWPSAHFSPTLAPYGNTLSLFGTDVQVLPCWQYTPVWGVTNHIGVCFNVEVGIHSTVSTALVGSTNRTYINVGTAFGTSYSNNLPTSMGVLMLWE